jgi:hypothetical protein
MTPAVEALAALGTGGLLALAGWQLLRTLLCAGFVLVVCWAQARSNGRYPTLDEATRALSLLLSAPAAVSRRPARDLGE